MHEPGAKLMEMKQLILTLLFTSLLVGFGLARECDDAIVAKRLIGPTDGSRGDVLVFYTPGIGNRQYFLNNKTSVFVRVDYVVGETRRMVAIIANGCVWVIGDGDLRIVAVTPIE